ncbi:helix-turn-helix transcriptional regulator [Streptomyces pseudovenezuelae]|uniref:Transcriptional regulator with XRE-family HTH domain n=1 Tax=Streptomyces pseudovenezuelae TaxID=67350 RepID=A0ABT6LLJ2_9ACTN|nr:helix-turn-helix transcriptional regulator [Streptomyces pseudovenezuelae]MDH6217163.1 transcriptional regulator with XRE-family HTH domain [Streptomyces pseudovenezuelae]
MLEKSYDFGWELRRRRMAARLSLQQLGQRVHYSKSQLSKVERGIKRPTPELARLCDAELDARGDLARLVPLQHSQPPLPAPSSDDEVWLMQLRKDGSSSFQPVTRRDLIAVGAASVLTMGSGDPRSVSLAPEGAETLVDASRLLFDQFRRLGQASGPANVLPPLIAQTHSLEQLALRSGPHARRELLLLASRYAEYAGWMAQECGDDTAAIWWTERAVQLAAAGADTALAAYAQVRRSLISLYRGDVSDAVQLASHALSGDAPSRIRGLAAQHLAQARAMEGDHDACMRSLDRARELLEQDAADPAQPVLGASHVPDVVSMFTGWCLYDLGRPRQAAVLLDEETARIPTHAFRTRARYGVRRALAHAAAGDIDHACRIATEILPSIGLIHSSTVLADLRRLAHTLGRHARHRSVREIVPDLSDVLARSATS